jgi:hypothetical protein
MKSKKHYKILKDYDDIKSKHLEKLADRLLSEDEKNQKLREKKININFLDKF